MFWKQLLFKLLGLLVLLGSLFVGWLLMSYFTFAGKPLDVGNDGAVVVVEPGTPLTVLARRLSERGILEHPTWFVWTARLSGNASRIQAGEFRIEPDTRPNEFIRQLVEGRVLHYGITLVEGWNFRQLRQALADSPYLTHTLEGVSDQVVMERLGKPNVHPEGRFFPDTYHFPRGLKDTALLQQAYQAMELRLAAEWEQRAVGLPYQTPYEALIMASIVEKETAVESERAQIAGVFVRRLVKGMRLQTDPTVIYGLGAEFDGNLRRNHLKARDNVYNTYRHNGLPPTPIAMPGADAIHAALHPDDGKTLYFVARGDGSHHFSATLEEHNQAVIRYQLNGKPRPFSSYGSN